MLHNSRFCIRTIMVTCVTAIALLEFRTRHTYVCVHSLQHSRYTDNGTAVSLGLPGFIMKYWPELIQSRVREAIQIKMFGIAKS